MKNVVIDELNATLAGLYGKNLTGQPRFRLVWSNDIMEHRYGSFNEYSGPIFLRTFVGTKLVRKYNYIQERWILEMWKIEHTRPSLNTPNPDGYEPLYVFEDGKGNPLPVAWKPIELILYNLLNPDKTPQQIKDSIETAYKEGIRNEEKYFEDMYAENSNYELHKRHHGERISNAGIITLGEE